MSNAVGKPLDTARGKRNDPYYVAQDILSRRDRTTHEMRTKLTQKGFSSGEIEKVMAWLQEKKLLNDEAFAERYIASTLRTKTVGRRWLYRKLIEKGLPADLVRQALETLVTVGQELSLAEQAAATWQARHPKHREDRTRLSRHLLSRGFSYEIITHITNPTLD